MKYYDKIILSKYNILIGKFQIDSVRNTLTDDTHIYTYIYSYFVTTLALIPHCVVYVR